MSVYIERDALEKWLLTEMASLDSDADRQCVVERLRKEIPAADVRPVVRGRWAETEMSGWDGDTAWVCSACGEPWSLIDGTPADNNMNYCPNCGADMREKS